MCVCVCVGMCVSLCILAAGYGDGREMLAAGMCVCVWECVRVYSCVLAVILPHGSLIDGLLNKVYKQFKSL